MGEERLHGILLGQVLIDVAHPAAPLRAGEAPEQSSPAAPVGTSSPVIRS